MRPQAGQRRRPGRLLPLHRLAAAAAASMTAALAIASLPAGQAAAAARAGRGPGRTAGLTAGGLAAWGLNSDGELGDGTTTTRNVPVPVMLPPTASVSSARSGCDFTLALTSTGQVLAWGHNDLGQLGNGTDGRTRAHSVRPVRARLPKGTRVRGLFAGCQLTLALTTKGKILAWGRNDHGQLGNGSKARRSGTPVRVKLRKGTRITAVTAGCVHALARTTSGRLLAWGDNFNGELGNGTTTSSKTPVRVRLPADRFAPIAIGAGPESDDSLAVVLAA